MESTETLISKSGLVGNLPVAAVRKAAHHTRVDGGAAVTGKVGANTVNEACVGISLGSIPHHDTAEAGESGGVINDRLEGGSRQVTRAGSTSVSRDTKNDLDIFVLGGVLGPLVPGVKVEGSLRAGARLEALNTAVVVVELNPDSIKGNNTVKHSIVSSIRVGTLRGGGQEVFLAGIGVHEAAKLVAKDVHVGNSGLEVKVKSINNSITERTRGRVVGGGTEGLPDRLSTSSGGIGAGEAAFAVGGTTDGKKNCFSLFLAGFDVRTIRCMLALVLCGWVQISTHTQLAGS